MATSKDQHVAFRKAARSAHAASRAPSSYAKRFGDRAANRYARSGSQNAYRVPPGSTIRAAVHAVNKALRAASPGSAPAALPVPPWAPERADTKATGGLTFSDARAVPINFGDRRPGDWVLPGILDLPDAPDHDDDLVWEDQFVVALERLNIDLSDMFAGLAARLDPNDEFPDWEPGEYDTGSIWEHGLDLGHTEIVGDEEDIPILDEVPEKGGEEIRRDESHQRAVDLVMSVSVWGALLLVAGAAADIAGSAAGFAGLTAAALGPAGWIALAIVAFAGVVVLIVGWWRRRRARRRARRNSFAGPFNPGTGCPSPWCDPFVAIDDLAVDTDLWAAIDEAGQYLRRQNYTTNTTQMIAPTWMAI